LANQHALWQFLYKALQAREPAALLVVVDSAGSSPGKVGAKMIVTLQASIGTIGGGTVETGLMKKARAALSKAEFRPQLIKQAHHRANDIEKSGMICGGEQTVLIYPCQHKDQVLIEELLAGYDDKTLKTLCISEQSIEVLPNKEPSSSLIFDKRHPWRYRETIGQCKLAYIIGAGHVGLALSQLLNMLDFDITVIDERENLDTMQANTYAQQKLRVPYKHIGQHIPEGPNTFVFIMTHSHHCDELVLAQLAGKQPAYLGLLGSHHKIDRIKLNLTQKQPGIPTHHLHAPIGLAINSHTPEEIAVSIAAEVIKLLNTKH